MSGGNVMKNHILLEKAFCYKDPKVVPKPQNCTYDNKKGYWLNNNNMAMVFSDSFIWQNSKKEDIETGEDQKGE